MAKVPFFGVISCLVDGTVTDKTLYRYGLSSVGLRYCGSSGSVSGDQLFFTLDSEADDRYIKLLVTAIKVQNSNFGTAIDQSLPLLTPSLIDCQSAGEASIPDNSSSPIYYHLLFREPMYRSQSIVWHCVGKYGFT